METFAFQLEVVSADGSLYSGKVKSVRVTGSEGELGIRYGHTPLLTTIKTGMVSIRINTRFLLVKSGFLKVGKTGQMARNLTKIHKFSPN